MEINVQCNAIQRVGKNLYNVEFSNSYLRDDDASLKPVTMRLAELGREEVYQFATGQNYIINIRKSREI